jgi:hypothetical protein
MLLQAGITYVPAHKYGVGDDVLSPLQWGSRCSISSEESHQHDARGGGGGGGEIPQCFAEPVQEGREEERRRLGFGCPLPFRADASGVRGLRPKSPSPIF